MKGDILNNATGPQLKKSNWWNAAIDDYVALMNQRGALNIAGTDQPLIAPEVTDPTSMAAYTSLNGPIIVPENVTQTLAPEVVNTINVANSNSETPVFETPMLTEDNQTITIVTSDGLGQEVGQVVNLGSGGGGNGFTEEPVVKADGGYVQPAKGITITGWVYPYPFLALTAAGGAIGYFVAKKFNQKILAMLALIAAGLMAGSAIGMKTFAPIRKV
jgi:hypothetical protein